MTDRARLPMYEGKDPNLLNEPRCVHCFETPATKLLRCSRCHVAWYCNTTCQKEHYANHRFLCMEIAKYEKLVLKEANKLRSILGDTIFETQTGNFWDIPHATTYMDVTYALSNWYCIVAHQSGVKEVWEKALFHILEHLRLGAIDQMEARWRAPFLLLSLNRDDDAYAFIRFWVTLMVAVTVNLIAMFEKHVNSKEGDWIYPREENCRYLDIFQDIFSTQNPQEVELPFLVALAIIKLRIVAAHDAALQSVDLAMEGTGQRIQEVQPALKDMLFCEHVDVESQRQQVNRLLDAIHLQNPSMLPALINPGPLTAQPPPAVYTPGQPSEAYRTLIDCKATLNRIPGAIDLLEERFGSNPTYNSNLA